MTGTLDPGRGDSGEGPTDGRSDVVEPIGVAARARGEMPNDRAMADRAKRQAEANTVARPRRAPAREIPIPTGLDAAETALIAGPYSPFWNLAPADGQEWQNIQQERAAAMAPALTSIRTRFGVAIEPTSLGGVGAFLLSPGRLEDPHKDRLVFYLHGGAYVLGKGESGTLEAVLMAAYSGYRVLCIDYRLAPQAPFPAALDDAVAAWCALIADFDPAGIGVAGVSAGGGLALALMLRLKAGQQTLPAAMALGSPWSDMTKTGDSYETNEWLDNVLVSYDGYLGRAGRLYAGGEDLYRPELSPIYGEFEGLPPTTLFTGTRDLFLSNTIRTHRKLREAGTEAELHVFDGLAHAQYALHADAAATSHAYREMALFFDKHLSRAVGRSSIPRAHSEGMGQ